MDKNVRALRNCLEKAGELEKRAFQQLPSEYQRLLAKDVFETEVKKKIEETEAYTEFSERRKAEFSHLTESRQQKIAELQELQQKLEEEQKQLERIKRQMFLPVDDEILFVRESGEEVEDENMPLADHLRVPQSFAFDSRLKRRSAADERRVSCPLGPNSRGGERKDWQTETGY